MPVLLKNAKHELFAQALAKGMPAIQAYAVAGYKSDRGAACRLSANVSIRARLNELLEKAAQRTLVTIERVTTELEEARRLAMTSEGRVGGGVGFDEQGQAAQTPLEVRGNLVRQVPGVAPQAPV